MIRLTKNPANRVSAVFARKLPTYNLKAEAQWAI